MLSSAFNNFNLLIVIIGSICQAIPKESDQFKVLTGISNFSTFYFIGEAIIKIIA
jgi:hypothetical protein